MSQRNSAPQDNQPQPMSITTVIEGQRQTGCLVSSLWFIFIGWWVGQLWVLVSWLLLLTIVGIPLGVMMLNRLPQVFALRKNSPETTITTVDGQTTITRSGPAQRSMLVRAVWFVLVGWWLSAIWMELAYLICLTLIGLPLGFLMFEKVPALVSLRRT